MIKIFTKVHVKLNHACSIKLDKFYARAKRFHSFSNF